MTTRILLTTTSYQDTPGPHHQLLESQGFEIVRERGPLPESAMLALAGDLRVELVTYPYRCSSSRAMAGSPS